MPPKQPLDSASSKSNIEEEKTTALTATSQSKTVSCSKVVRHKTHLKCNGVVLNCISY